MLPLRLIGRSVNTFLSSATSRIGLPESVRIQLVRGGIASVVLKVGGLGISLAISLILAASLGADGYGIYAYVLALVNLLSAIAQFGLPSLVVRETAKLQSTENWATLKYLWYWSGLTATGLAVSFIALSSVTAWLFAERFTNLQLVTFGWGLALVPLLVWAKLTGSAIRGLHFVLTGQLPDFVLRPCLFIVFIFWALVFGTGELKPSDAMVLHVSAGATAVVFGALLLYAVRPEEYRNGVRDAVGHRGWAASAGSLGVVAAMQMVNRQGDILVLGLFADASEVGIYRIAMQGASLVALGLDAVNLVVAPRFARLHAQEEYGQLQRLATISARTSLIIALAVVVILIVFGRWLLEEVVGAEYVMAMLPLLILAAGQLVNAGMGFVTLLLNMTGQERTLARGVTVGALGNVAGNLILVPYFGMVGAALSTAATFVFWNFLLAIEVYKRFGINSTAFAKT